MLSVGIARNPLLFLISSPVGHSAVYNDCLAVPFFPVAQSQSVPAVFAGHLHSGGFLTKLWFVLAPTSWWNRPVVCIIGLILSDLISLFVFVFKILSLVWHEYIKYIVRCQKGFERVDQRRRSPVRRWPCAIDRTSKSLTHGLLSLIPRLGVTYILGRIWRSCCLLSPRQFVLLPYFTRWFNQECIQDKIKLQRMVMGSLTSLRLTGIELIYIQLEENTYGGRTMLPS